MDNQAQNYDSSFDSLSRIRDLEEKLRLVKDRLLLVTQNFIEDRNKTFKEVQEMKKTLLKLEEENLRMREFIRRATEQLENVPRKEELARLQRQFDLFRQ